MTARLTPPGAGEPDGEPDVVGETEAGSAPLPAKLDEPLEIADVEVEPAVPEAQAVVAAPVAPEPSKRFRAASRAYPTLNRRRSGFTSLLVVLIVLGAAAGAAVKLHLKDRFFPAAAPPAPIAEPAPAAQAPAAATPPAAPEGAGGAAAVAATPPAQPAPAEKAAPDNAVAEKAAEKAQKAASDEKKPSEPAAAPANEEHAAKHRPQHHKTAEAAAAAPAAASAAASPSPEKPAAEKAPAEKPATEQPAPEKAAEGAPAEKPAAAAPAPAEPILKVTSSPSGAQVLIDGRELGSTPFVSKEVDPSAPHTITIKKDGYEPNERMVSGLDWSRPHGSEPADAEGERQAAPLGRRARGNALTGPAERERRTPRHRRSVHQGNQAGLAVMAPRRAEGTAEGIFGAALRATRHAGCLPSLGDRLPPRRKRWSPASRAPLSPHRRPHPHRSRRRRARRTPDERVGDRRRGEPVGDVPGAAAQPARAAAGGGRRERRPHRRLHHARFQAGAPPSDRLRRRHGRPADRGAPPRRHRPQDHQGARPRLSGRRRDSPAGRRRSWPRPDVRARRRARHAGGDPLRRSEGVLEAGHPRQRALGRAAGPPRVVVLRERRPLLAGALRRVRAPRGPPPQDHLHRRPLRR